MNILVAEDETVTRKLLQRLLVSLGHEVTAVENGTQAWEHLQTSKVRVVVSDWMMPDSDGLDLCRRVRERSEEDYVYFILLTSVSRNKNTLHQASTAGVDDFLTKPVNHDEIWMRLRVAERILTFTRQIRQLESFLPICAYCKKIRNDGNYWQQIETYINERTGTDFSHSICPDCYENHVKPELAKLKKTGPGSSGIGTIARP